MSVTEHRVLIAKESLKKVTVFEDRAELQRELAVELAPGLNKIILQLAAGHSVDADSVRVTSKGDAVIEDVELADRRVAEGECDTMRAKQIRAEKEALESEDRVLRHEIDSLTDGLEGLKKMIQDPKMLEDFGKFYGCYEKQSGELRDKLYAKEQISNKKREAINLKERDLNMLGNGDWVKEVSILLSSSAGGRMVLELSYQVTEARWYPIYDVRVNTKETKVSMQLSYYGNVTQRTGEDWEGIPLILSSARPCLGGNLPWVGSLDLSLEDPKSKRCAPPMRQMQYGYRMAAQDEAVEEEETEKESALDNSGVSVDAKRLSTEFTIGRACSIPSDGANHKVTIGTFTMEPHICHQTVPSKKASAFLTAYAPNSTSLPLMAGQASVYLDGAFVTKTETKAASPGEIFVLSLGADPAVKIEYRSQKFTEKINGTDSRMVTTQTVTLKNAGVDAVSLTVRHQIPRSTDDRCKVTLLQPEGVDQAIEENLTKGWRPLTPGVRQAPNKLIKWTVDMAKGASTTMVFQFAIEYPSELALKYTEKCNQ
ncbi:hypothetical protein PENTCL1PPCAC_14492 [Pristionchus entomophagus]|uniref:DUF4139 domain-containing protein n=1 Tax=Pristionchus entomophagus TaxID=358040 RepID=A0AAV5TBL4_9BILA|nr:hypothetical protein PENTCL1PPCAC_14492 [Pristionchus entomophagus]